MTTLQTFLIGKPPLLLHHRCCRLRQSKFLWSSVSISAAGLVNKKSDHCRRRVITCALHSDTANSSSESVLNGAAEVSGLEEEKPEASEFLRSEFEEGGVVDGETWSSGESEEKVEGLVEEGSGVSRELVEKKSGIPLMVLLVGLWARIRKGMEAALPLEWMNWWPFGQKEKLLERLIAEAEANPLDAEKQSALFVELNKHRYCL